MGIGGQVLIILSSLLCAFPVSANLRSSVHRQVANAMRPILIFRSSGCSESSYVAFNGDRTGLVLRTESSLQGAFCTLPHWANDGSGRLMISTNGVDRFKWTGSSLEIVAANPASFIQITETWRLSAGNTSQCDECISGPLFIGPPYSCSADPAPIHTQPGAFIYQVGSGSTYCES